MGNTFDYAGRDAYLDDIQSGVDLAAKYGLQELYDTFLIADGALDPAVAIPLIELLYQKYDQLDQEKQFIVQVRFVRTLLYQCKFEDVLGLYFVDPAGLSGLKVSGELKESDRFLIAVAMVGCGRLLACLRFVDATQGPSILNMKETFSEDFALLAHTALHELALIDANLCVPLTCNDVSPQYWNDWRAEMDRCHSIYSEGGKFPLYRDSLPDQVAYAWRRYLGILYSYARGIVFDGTNESCEDEVPVEGETEVARTLTSHYPPGGAIGLRYSPDKVEFTDFIFADISENLQNLDYIADYGTGEGNVLRSLSGKLMEEGGSSLKDFKVMSYDLDKVSVAFNQYRNPEWDCMSGPLDDFKARVEEKSGTGVLIMGSVCLLIPYRELQELFDWAAENFERVYIQDVPINAFGETSLYAAKDVEKVPYRLHPFKKMLNQAGFSDVGVKLGDKPSRPRWGFVRAVK